jgi:DNA-binding transcriptional LysR family regulator
MNVSWEDLRLFLVVSEKGSLSAAARALQLGQPTLSRRMAELEVLVGAPLFLRKSSGVELTDLAKRMLPSTQRMAEWASETEQLIASGQQKPQGKVRIAAPPGIAFDFLAPFAAVARKRFPGIQIESLSHVEYLNLARGEADLAIRVDAPDDSALLCLEELRVPVSAFASKKYAKSLPKKPKIQEVQWIGWPLERGDFGVSSSIQEHFPPGTTLGFTSNDFLVQLSACEAGLGAMLLLKLNHSYSRIGSLVELPFPGEPLHSTLSLVCSKRAIEIPRIQAIAGLLHAEFEQMRAEAAK